MYHLKNNPVTVKNAVRPPTNQATGNTDHVTRAITTKISAATYEGGEGGLGRGGGAEEAMGLEKGMIVLSTAVAGGPFIGLLGTVWGVMSTFAGIAVAQQGQPDGDGARRGRRAGGHGHRPAGGDSGDVRLQLPW